MTKTLRSSTSALLAKRIGLEPFSGYVLVASKVAERFDNLATDCVSGSEQGGILIGSYRGPHVEIVSMTFPGPMDIGTRSSFARVDRTHQAAATRAWRSSGGTRTYVGEWHTHPGGEASPSFLDRRAWGQVSTDIGQSGVFAIVAPGTWKLFVMDRKLQWSVKSMKRYSDGTGYVGFGCA